MCIRDSRKSRGIVQFREGIVNALTTDDLPAARVLIDDLTLRAKAHTAKAEQFAAALVEAQSTSKRVDIPAYKGYVMPTSTGLVEKIGLEAEALNASLAEVRVMMDNQKANPTTTAAPVTAPTSNTTTEDVNVPPVTETTSTPTSNTSEAQATNTPVSYTHLTLPTN